MEYHQKKPNKIREIVRLQLILKKWRKLAINSSSSSSSSAKPSSAGNKSMQFLKRTISFSDRSTGTSSTELLASSSNSNTTSTNSSTNNQHQAVPKGYLAVCVGEEMKRFVIPTEYLGRHAFRVLLREAEEEFGFEQTGVLRIPCEVSVFESVLKMVQQKRGRHYHHHRHHRDHHDYDHDQFCYSSCGVDKNVDVLGCCSSGSPLQDFSHHSDHSPMCR